MFIYQEVKHSDQANTSSYLYKVFAVAPMLDWSDRHYRFFARLLSKNALLYTEMIVADAILKGNKQRLLSFSPQEHPLALQIGGANPVTLATAAKIGEEFGYDEINLNVGCPSNKVQSGSFGACLMLLPEHIMECVYAIKKVVSIPVTIKCRIGVDDQVPELALRNLIKSVKAASVDAVWIHARKAFLKGLSPSENRKVPPLNYEIIYEIKRENPDLFIGLNGGLKNVQHTLQVLPHVDGVMLGRASYQNSTILTSVDQYFINPLTGSHPVIGEALDKNFWDEVCTSMISYASQHLNTGGQLRQVVRHMLGLFQGFPGVQRYRRILGVEAIKPEVMPTIIKDAFNSILSD
ncbi:putative tRNA-dihydrouridine synthase A [Liberibacter crescens BT-1]|uniref:tRNA-dihydrouridine(20/20a) synthase n=1 Tax=Liberibacter crescens (strain BT-1) TaxID=1215343 RepID=L0EW50_LIBCB|nr:tRNA dihydrouridine(20/20a) synthase DusA [Liberibacter crescens]AGA64596.1 putative tRNA-dihydrouridine synthase A [Liberibacter crescens BT-1]AMC12724.1 tRNA-dihydrouridine synthase A [Liberibacter crescens]